MVPEARCIHHLLLCLITSNTSLQMPKSLETRPHQVWSYRAQMDRRLVFFSTREAKILLEIRRATTLIEKGDKQELRALEGSLHLVCQLPTKKTRFRSPLCTKALKRMPYLRICLL